MTDSRDSAMSLVRDGHHPGKNARPRESFPRDVFPVAIRANDTLSAQPGEGRKAKKKKYCISIHTVRQADFYLCGLLFDRILGVQERNKIASDASSTL